MAAEGSSKNDSAASEPAQTSAPNLLDINGTQVCHEHLFNRIDAETEQETQGVDNQNGPSMHAMGAFVLSPEEECLMESELTRLKRESFVVKVVGSRPNRAILRDWLQSCLQEDLGRLKDIAFMGKGFYHVIVMPETNVCKIVESSPLIWHNARAYVFNWDADFDMCKADAYIGNPTVVTTFFPGLPKQWESFLPAIGKSMGGQCLEKTLAERISETPRIKLIVSDVKTLPQSMLLSSKQMADHVQTVEYVGLPGQCFACRQMGHMARECPRGKENMHHGNGKQGQKCKTSLMQQKNQRMNHALSKNEDGWKHNTYKGKQKVMVGQEWLPLRNKYALLTLEDNEYKPNEREERTKATHESNYVEVINDMTKLHQEDNLVGDVIGQMLPESIGEVGELNIGKVVSPLKEQSKSLVTTLDIKGIAKMKRHMRAKKEEMKGMEKNKGMRKWPRVNWNLQYKAGPLSNTGQQIKVNLTGKKWFKELCGSEMKKDNICRVNIYGKCSDGGVAGLSYILALGTKEPHSREEALGCLEQQMDVYVDASYGTAIGMKMKRQWKDALIWSSGKANEQGICFINVKFRKLPNLITEFMVYVPEMLTQLEEENLQDRILATILEAENALAGPQKVQLI